MCIRTGGFPRNRGLGGEKRGRLSCIIEGMARQRSNRVDEIKSKVRTRLREGLYRPGDRFLSTRDLATHFGVSYQTAHVLMDELCTEGLLERRAASGTFIPGGPLRPIGAALCFSPRAQRPNSFGARLLDGLTRRLDRDGVPWRLHDLDAPLPPDRHPVLWEAPELPARCAEARRSILLLNDRPPPGLQAAFIDSISIDDFSGGVSAGQLLRLREGEGDAYAVLTGPADDARSQARRDGYLSVVPHAAVVEAQSWFLEDGLKAAGEAARLGRDGLFCCNDRLAEAVILHCRERGLPRPPLVGFDDAPVAEQLDLTTIAIPWEELIADAVEILKRRLAGDATASRQLIVTPRPVIRRR